MMIAARWRLAYPARMMLFGRVPRLSRPFVRAAFWDATGMGLLNGLAIPFYGVLARRMGAGDSLMALLAMAPFLGFLASLRIARLSGTVGWGRLLGWSRVACYLSLMGFAVMTGPVGFTLLATLIIATGSSVTSLSGNLLRGHIRPLFRGEAMKWMRVVAILGAVPLAWQAGGLFDVDATSYRIVFPLTGLLALATVPFLFRLPRRQSEVAFQDARTPALGEEFRILRHDRRFRIFLMVFFIGTFGEKIGMPVLPVYFADVLNLSYRHVATTLGIAGPLASIGGYFFWSHVARRTGNPLLVLAVCMTLKGIRPVALALAIYTDSPVELVAAAEAVFRFLIAGLDIASLLCVLDMAPAHKTPHYLGLHFWLMGVRGIAGPLIGWLFLATGVPLHLVFWLITVVVLVGGLGLWLLVVRSPADTGSSRVAGSGRRL